MVGIWCPVRLKRGVIPCVGEIMKLRKDGIFTPIRKGEKRSDWDLCALSTEIRKLKKKKSRG